MPDASICRRCVSSSSRARGRAAWVVGQFSARQREDSPPLLLEAFVTLLSDPFVYPISSTVTALRHVKLAEPLEKRVAGGLAAIINANSENRSQSRLVVDCIRLFAARYVTPEQLGGQTGETLLAILEQHAAEYYTGELRFLPNPLALLPGFGRLVVKSLQDADRMEHGADDIFSALRRLGPPMVVEIRRPLLEIALASADTPEGNRLRGVFIEVFTAVGDWDAATQVAEHAVSLVPETRRDAFRRLRLLSLLGAVCFERAIAEGRPTELPRLATEWKASQRQLAEMSA